MAGAWIQRPSLLLGAWSLAVVAVFVWRGDLRVAPATAAPLAVDAQRAAGAQAEPRVVRAAAPAPAAARSPVLRRGRVFDALGFLVVGAEVVPMERAPTRTDGDGAFAVELTAGGSMDLLVRARGQRPVWVRTGDGSPDVLALQLTPAAPWDELPSPPPPMSLLRGEGVVRTTDGQPLAGAFVTALGTATWARTDDIGRFTLPLPTPSATLLVHAPAGGAGDHGFVSAARTFVTERPRGAVPLDDLVAGPALAIRGIVHDARGLPIAGVPVEIVGPALRRVVDTGPGGAFRVGGLAPGAYEARPFAWRGAVGVPMAITLAAESTDVDLRLVAADETRLRVVDERGGPVAGVYVATTVGGTRRGVAQADPDGYAAVPLASETAFDVRAAVDFTPLAVRRFEPEPATLVVAMP